MKSASLQMTHAVLTNFFTFGPQIIFGISEPRHFNFIY